MRDRELIDVDLSIAAARKSVGRRSYDVLERLGNDVPTLLTALDVANRLADAYARLAMQLQAERDLALAAVQRVEALRDELTGIRLPSAVVVDVARKLTELLADPEGGAS